MPSAATTDVTASHHLIDETMDQGAFQGLGFCSEAAAILAALQGAEPRLSSVVYLYDAKGSELFEEITRQPEYYLTRAEQGILETHAEEIALFPDERAAAGASSPPLRACDSLFVELGAGSGKKMSPVLQAAAALPHAPAAPASTGCTDATAEWAAEAAGQEPRTVYVPVDYSESALEENLTVYNRAERYPDTLQLEPFVGTNTQAIERLATRRGRKTFVFLGSSLGNEVDPVPLLSLLAAHLGARDRLLLGVDLAADDRSQPEEVIHRAYNDSAGVTERFILNSLAHINRLVSGLDFDTGDFRMSAEYDRSVNAVVISLRCVRPCTVSATSPSTGERVVVRRFASGESIFIEQCGKFSPSTLEQHLCDAGLLQTDSWLDPLQHFAVLELVPDLVRRQTRTSEFIFRGLVGEDKLSSQPVDLRHPFAFYWGHIASFTDRFTLELPGRAWERETFERGIDPDVDEPSKCHAHSQALEEWPPACELHAYALEVEHGLRAKVAREGVSRDTLVALEHGDMHHETLMYMGMEEGWRSSPDHPWAAFADGRSRGSCRNKEAAGTRDIVPRTVQLGASADDVAALGFVWDNELPGHLSVDVPAFSCSRAAVTNAEFAAFVDDGGYHREELWQLAAEHGGDSAWNWARRSGLEAPHSWVSGDEGWSVKTLCDGPAHLAQGAGDWPAMVTAYEALAYCRWHGHGARLMLEAEYHALFADDEDFRRAALLGNNNWKHRGFVPVGTMDDAASLSGAFDLVGNGWEWTATKFAPFPGFEPTPDYPGYSRDFFDGKHYVLKGGGWATSHGLLRPSFRNWFQANYPYPTAKFRLVF